MHELGICQEVLSASIAAAEKQGAVSIKEIRLDVGDLTEVVEYALQFAFESIAPGTMAEGATLVVNHIPSRSRCGQCGHEFEHGRFDAICPKCDNPFNESISGHELDISSIDVELPDEDEDTAARDDDGVPTAPPEPSDASGEPVSDTE